MAELTQLLTAAADGGVQASSELFPLVYDELRRIAATRLSGQTPGHSLDATALVHEVYLRFRDGRTFENRGHFFASAAQAMRHILIESARRKNRIKRGGNHQRVDLDDLDLTIGPDADDILAIDEALTRLKQEDPEAAEVVHLHFFAGLPIEEAAEVLGISRATGYRQWNYARAWLKSAIGGKEA